LSASETRLGSAQIYDTLIRICNVHKADLLKCRARGLHIIAYGATGTVELMFVYRLSMCTPNALSAPITAIQITAINTPYSVAVGPSSDHKNCFAICKKGPIPDAPSLRAGKTGSADWVHSAFIRYSISNTE